MEGIWGGGTVKRKPMWNKRHLGLIAAPFVLRFLATENWPKMKLCQALSWFKYRSKLSILPLWSHIWSFMFPNAYVRVGSNISQNHKSSVQEVISGHYFTAFIWKFDQKWKQVKLELFRTLLKITHFTSRKSYLVIIYPQFIWKDHHSRN